jgi:hypothetical protein
LIDLNDVTSPPAPQVRHDLDAIVERLRATAESWVPRHFPNGRRVGDDWRLANIQGEAPRKQGSCVITLKGEHAGDWIDFDDNHGGGPISALEQATGLSGRALIEYAATMAGSTALNGKRHVTAEAQRQPDRRQDTAREIEFILSRTAPLAGTIAETYLRSRGLVAPATEDLLFHADLTYWDTRTGHPAMVAVVRGRGGETIAIHRTYLAEDGSGKADLPKPRMMLGRVGGGAVRLAPVGDDGVVGIAEGIETALSVMQACPGLPVWAALSAGNIEHPGLPPGIREVVILVDNDPTGAGLAAAERAAQRFHGEGRRVWTALPPRVGDDFNDLLRRDGAEAVRAVVHAAVPWGGDGTAAKASQRAAAAEVDEVARTAAMYPLPTVEGIDLRYLRTRKGAILVHRHAGKDKDGATIWRVVASPFGIPARLRYLDQDDAYGLRMLIRDMQGEPRAVDFPRAGLARQGAQDIRSALYAAGLRSYGDGDQVALAMLKAADPPSEILVVSRPGWHRLDGRDHPVFVTPAGHAIGDAPVPALELATHARYDTGRGSLDGWKTAAAAAASLKGCPHFALGVLAGLAGVVQSLTGLDSCGLNLSGLSSSGKTMAQRLAVSAWTSTAVGAGLLQSMRSTENAIEVFAQAASGTVLALDELAHADGRAIAKLIYAIAGGQGKARMTAGAILKQRYAWSTYALLSSECSLEEKVRADGAAWIAGMAVRILDIDVTDVDRSVPAPTLKAIADVENHCGHAGPAFVERLVAAGLHHAPDALRDRILAEARRLAHANPDAARLRAATCLAVLLIVGQLAQDFDLLPASIDLEAPVHWAWERFEKSSDAEALVPEEQAIARLRAWIAERWDVTIKSVDAGHESFDRKLNNREAVAWYDEVAIYVPTERLREAAGETLKTQLIVKALEERDLLARRHDAKRAAVRWVPKVGQLQCYALRREAFGRSSSTHGWSVVQGGED